MQKALVVALLLVLAVAAVPVAAQSLTGTVTGVVKDEQGGVLPGVTMVLAGKAAARNTVTGTDGTYRFAAVDPGTYSLTAELASFRPRRQDNIVVSVSKQAEVNFTLTVGQMTENVEVVGEAPVVDVASSSTDNSLSQDMLFNLPIRPTNAAVEMLNYLPGINDGSAFGGNSDYANSLLIDGVDTRDPDAGSSWVFFNYNLMEEVQVGGVGANAEYGSYTGAVVNTIMKSGGNRFTGLFDAYWTKDSFWSDNVTQEQIALNPTLADPAVVNKRLDISGQIGGPIVKDKLFFFVAAQRYEQEDNPSGPTTLHKEVSPRLNAKITWQPGPKDNVSANFQYDNYNNSGRAPGSIGSALTTDELTLKQDSPEFVYGLQWRHLFGTKTFTEVKYSGWWGYYYLDPAVNSPAFYDASTNLWSGGAPYHYYADRLRNQVNASISKYAEGWGKHDLKFGLEIERSNVHSRFGYTGGGYYYDYTAYYPKGQYLVYDYSYDSEGHNQRESLYLQDAWKPTDRLTINAGVRVDFLRAKSPKDNNETVYSSNNWAPRIGFAYDLTGDSKTVVKGHYGQYYEALLFYQYERSMSGFTDFIGYSYDPNGEKCMPGGNCFTFSQVALPYPRIPIDSNMKQPRVDEWTAGFERALSKDLRLSVTGIYRQDKNIEGTVYPDARWNPITVTNGLTGQPMTVYEWANPDESELSPIYTNVDGFQYKDPDGNVLGTAQAYRKYKALMFVLDKRFSNRWQGRISYVLSKNDATLNNDSANSYGQSTKWETPTRALVNSVGRPTYDRTHEVKIYGTFQVPKVEIGLNVAYKYLSGAHWTPYQRFSSKVINYPLSSGRQPYLEPFGNRLYEPEKSLDLRLEKIFTLADGSRIAVYADVQNLLNESTVLNLQTRYPGASVNLPGGTGETAFVDFQSPTQITQPRRWLLGARWSF